jgi:Protein of unknown function (DUF1153)
MFEPGIPRMKHVIGPDGGLLTIADLPAPETKRWVIRRKAVVVAAVRGGLLTRSLHPLRADGRRTPRLGIFDRSPRSRWATRYPRPEIRRQGALSCSRTAVIIQHFQIGQQKFGSERCPRQFWD